MDSKNHMTVGFIFNWDLEKVLLVMKNRPDWQKGFLNGIGGHLTVREVELSLEREGWVREVREETNILLDVKKVKRIGLILAENRKINVTVFAYRLPPNEPTFKSMTDEEVSWVTMDLVHMAETRIIGNLRHLIPLAKYRFEQFLLKDSSLILEYR